MRILWIIPLVLYSHRVRAGLADDIVEAIQDGGTCMACHALLVPLKGLAMFGDWWFTATITSVCKLLNVVDDDVCDGAIRLQGPILANDLRSIDPFGHTATKFCDALFGLCQPPEVNQWQVPFPKPAPQIHLSKHHHQAPFSGRRPPFQVVHFSDVHIDRQYTTGTDANCTKPICCRPYEDRSGPIVAPAGGMGDYNCDTPVALAHDMLRAISANNKFSIFTGDVSEASVWLANQEEITNNMELFNADLLSILGAPVFPAIGNHESSPTNSFPRSTTTNANTQWIFDTQSKGWLPFIHESSAAQVQHFSGSYSAVAPGTNLRIISINTLYWYKNNYWLYDSDEFQPDPNGILAFIIQELQAAEDIGQGAWIIGHMPPGSHDALQDQSNYFDQVVQRYRHVIRGQFYGHTHQDQFNLAYSDYKQQTAENAISVGWIAPAVTPRGGNPGFKVYDVDPDTYEIMDSRVYRTDLSHPSFQTDPTWELYYSARDVYGAFIGGWPSDVPLNPAFWHKVTEAFETNDAAFQTYLSFLRGGFGTKRCNAECRRITICDIRAMRAEDGCSVSKPGLSIRKDESWYPQVESCEGADIAHVLTHMASFLSTEDLVLLRDHLRIVIPPEADAQRDL